MSLGSIPLGTFKCPIKWTTVYTAILSILPGLDDLKQKTKSQTNCLTSVLIIEWVSWLTTIKN